MRKLVIAGLLLVVVLIAAACGGDGDSDSSGMMDGDLGHDMNAQGEAADPSEADRTIKVEALDELAFSPASLSVEAGEVVTFEITNGGQALHEFVLGDVAFQESHAEDMADGGSDEMGHMENGLTLAPGESGTITWRFTESGEVLYACHVPGHYEGGMVGTIDVG